MLGAVLADAAPCALHRGVKGPQAAASPEETAASLPGECARQHWATAAAMPGTSAFAVRADFYHVQKEGRPGELTVERNHDLRDLRIQVVKTAGHRTRDLLWGGPGRGHEPDVSHTLGVQAHQHITSPCPHIPCRALGLQRLLRGRRKTTGEGVGDVCDAEPRSGRCLRHPTVTSRTSAGSSATGAKCQCCEPPPSARPFHCSVTTQGLKLLKPKQQ
ncbi:PREDICTED: uncharacterized protein LOC102026824 [Chinchilla lanigera]|uniref:uncharacterized protein LOC102026824 n=1 Tax=Chinchilla lanigera TaxID=34839 RepID=UPI00069789C6|nr:PREDICTED: uncharacterized protein LOC102026824 [Chinchilla lanigera]